MNNASVFLKSGSTYKVASTMSLDLHEALPAGNYTLKSDPLTGELFLDKSDDFLFNFKLYGDIDKQAARILHTFESRFNSTGVLLSGEKGSGKTLLAKRCCERAAFKWKVPTIMINAAYRGDGFNTFLQSIQQPTVVLFDEFEKVYDRDQQPSILTLLDGVFPSKKLFILTCNDKYRVDHHMKNRPGRIFYMLDFDGLGTDFIKEYCEDNLHNKKHIDKIVQITATFDKFNFDMLKALVEEMNRFKEGPVDSLKMLNVKAEFGGAIIFSWEFLENGKAVDPSRLVDNSPEFTVNPFIGSICFYLGKVEEKGKKKQILGFDDADEIYFKGSDLVGIENANKFTYVKDQYTLILTKKPPKNANFSYDAF